MAPQKKIQETKREGLEHFDQILKKATEKKASDLHFKAGLPPIVRVNGHLYYLSDENKEYVSRLSVQELHQYAHALMNSRQLEKYENGEEVDLGYEIPGGGRFRINICQQRSNPRLVCRYIPEVIRTLNELSLPPTVSQLVNAKRGLVLVTGATGSGKSTTLAALIDHIARTRSCHIVTIEDPIEFIFKDRKSIVTQREVGLDTRNFAQALKYSLRQDPDVILVGEMRDEETMLMAMSAAETGHLVLSTLHTVDATETINRILGSISVGMQGQARLQLASVLIGVVSQRLVRRKDGKGRIPAVEVLVSNQRVKDMILDPARTQDIKRAIEESESSGMQSFDQSLMALHQQGLITVEEALLNSSNSKDFQLRLTGVLGGEQWRDEHENTATRASQHTQTKEENDSQIIEIEYDSVSRSKK